MPARGSSALQAVLLATSLLCACGKDDGPVLDLQNDPKFRYQSGLSALRAGNADKAVRELEAAHALEPKDVDVLHALGLALSETNRGSKAVEVLTEALALKPNDGQILNSRAVAFMRQRRFDEAVKDFQAALEPAAHYDTPEYALLNLAGALSEMQRFDEALATLDRALATNPRDPAIHTARCRIYDLAKRTDDAFAACRQAVTESPTYAPGYFELGKLLLKVGRNTEALTAFESSLKLEPKGEYADQARRYQALLSPTPAPPPPSAMAPLASPAPTPDR